MISPPNVSTILWNSLSTKWFPFTVWICFLTLSGAEEFPGATAVSAAHSQEPSLEKSQESPPAGQTPDPAQIPDSASTPGSAEADSVVDAADITAAVLTDERVLNLIESLHSSSFAERQQAIAELSAVRPAQVALLADAAENQEHAEVGNRLFKLLETIYISDDPERSLAACEVLEQSASSERWMVAELAADILDRQWQRRSRLAIAELQTLGARFNSDDVLQFAQGPGGRNRFFFQPINLSQLQIKLDKSWKGGQRGMALLERLATVVTGGGPVGEIRTAVYLIDHHPLEEAEVVRLKSAFGDARVVARGRVFLGISNSLFFAEDKGCRVGEVTEGGSAHAAGIQTDDIIRSVDGVEIRDFDHLVQLLRNYEVGDKVEMKIERGMSPYPLPDAPREIRDEQPEPEKNVPLGGRPRLLESRQYRGRLLTISVEMKGW